MEQEELISISEAHKRLDTSIYIIRHFCDGGYIPHIRRDRHYRRLLTPEQFELLATLIKMKDAGFTRPELKRYARLYRQGSATEPERLAILTTRKRQLWQEIKTRQAAIDFIERQEEIYDA